MWLILHHINFFALASTLFLMFIVNGKRVLFVCLWGIGNFDGRKKIIFIASISFFGFTNSQLMPRLGVSKKVKCVRTIDQYLDW